MDHSYVMHNYYVLLVRGLVGYYVKFSAPSEEIVSENTWYAYSKLPCKVYNQDDIDALAAKHTVCIINEEDPIILPAKSGTNLRGEEE